MGPGESIEAALRPRVREAAGHEAAPSAAIIGSQMVEGMSIRKASRAFGLHRHTVRKMVAYSAPAGYRRQVPPRRPKLEPFPGVIDRVLEDDLRVYRNGSDWVMIDFVYFPGT